MCIQTLLNILKHNQIFKDVYREVGMLEVFVTCLDRYAKMLETKKNAEELGKEYVIPPGQEKLGGMVIEALTILLSSSAPNANVLRECGGAKCVHGLVAYQDCRQTALGNNKSDLFLIKLNIYIYFPFRNNTRISFNYRWRR